MPTSSKVSPRSSRKREQRDAKSFCLRDHTTLDRKYPDRLQPYSLLTPNGVKVSVVLEKIRLL
ncbi:hypothetical protein V1283_005821 [Bradyrhizobium sp. AZCC 2262]